MKAFIFYMLYKCLSPPSARALSGSRIAFGSTLFGVGRETSETWWKALSRELVAERYLMETMGHNKFSTLCKLTAKVLDKDYS